MLDVPVEAPASPTEEEALSSWSVAAGRKITLRDFSARLTAWRSFRGWTRRELAERAGVHEQALYEWEKGRKSPTLTSADKVLDALGVDPIRFFHFTPAEEEIQKNPALRPGAAKPEEPSGGES